MVLLAKGAQVEAWFGLFGGRAILDPILDAQFAWNIPYTKKSIWTHPIELLDDVCHKKTSLGLFRDSVCFDARYVHGV